MAQRQAIRGEGNAAEKRFFELVPGSLACRNAKEGDAIVPIDGANYFVEVKECHAELGKGGTINQVRAIKFITCVVWAPNHDCWYVISPDQLVQIAAGKSRGQHTEIAFECMNLSLT